jgi:DNA-binding NarL/FixJ family response regulator
MPEPANGPFRVLLFNVPPSSLDPGACFLGRNPFAAEACSQGEDFVQRVNKTEYKLVILALPSGGLDPVDVIYNVRQEKAASRCAVIVVLAPDDKVQAFQPFLAKGISSIFPLSAPALNLETALAGMLKVAPRIAARIMVRLAAKVQQFSAKHLCQATNISQTGMFVATNLTLPSGAEVVFELLLPNQPSPILGEAKVARHSRGIGAGSSGLGLHFTMFKLDGRNRIEAFLEAATPHR